MIIGISGKSGSGKTYVANELAKQFNAIVISFDEISHKAIETDKFINTIKNRNDLDVFDKNGKILRKKLGEIAFSNSDVLDLINKTAEEIMVEMIDEKLKSLNSKNIIFEYALLTKMKYFNMCDVKILVDADENILKERILTRDNISSEYYNLRKKNGLIYNKNDFDIIYINDKNSDINNLINQIKNKENLC